jgi:predicted nucleic acid-binding protein
VIVSNTTPLSSLLKIGQIGLLERLYGSVVIPTEVAAELDQAGQVHEHWREQAGTLELLRVRGGLWLSDAFLDRLRSSYRFA